MAGETANIAEIADIVSSDLFQWFKWDTVPLRDENFDCVKQECHANDKRFAHTHPVDVVFKYFDPYLNKNIYLNTDLKSYNKSSINASNIRKSLQSLARTIECSKASKEWKDKYVLENDPYEIRGLLFIYNHDGGFDKSFYDHFKGIRADNLPIKKNQYLHVVEPNLIQYMTTVVADMARLHKEKTFPDEAYRFYYPELYLHKTHGRFEIRQATIEVISSPFMVVHHDAVSKLNEKTNMGERVYDEGYVIYYNRDGSSEHEFMYLLDFLSGIQVLNKKGNVRVRVAHHAPDNKIKSNFERAKNLYLSDWGYDDYKREVLDAISLDIVQSMAPTYNPGAIGWRLP